MQQMLNIQFGSSGRIRSLCPAVAFFDPP